VAKAMASPGLEWQERREAGFTEQRSLPASNGGRITGRCTMGPLGPRDPLQQIPATPLPPLLVLPNPLPLANRPTPLAPLPINSATTPRPINPATAPLPINSATAPPAINSATAPPVGQIHPTPRRPEGTIQEQLSSRCFSPRVLAWSSVGARSPCSLIQ